MCENLRLDTRFEESQEVIAVCFDGCVVWDNSFLNPFTLGTDSP